VKLTRLMLRMNSDDDEGSSLVADDEAHLSCLADCGLHKHHPFISYRVPKAVRMMFVNAKQAGTIIVGRIQDITYASNSSHTSYMRTTGPKTESTTEGT
jgi:hypothetical protein